LVKYRAARQDRAPHLFAPNDIETIAQTRLVSNPNDGDSLFVLAIGGKKKNGEQRLKFLERCVNLHPSDADFHFLLADAYHYMARYDQCLSACTRAVELSSNIEHMILQVDTIILLNKIRRSACLLSDGTYTKVPTYTTDEIIAMLERILILLPTDHEQIPETHYKLSEMHLLRGHYSVARDHWRMARKTAAPDIRLPCFEPVDHDRYLKVNAWMLENNEKILSTHFDIIDGSAAKVKTCDHCGKEKPSKRCICGLVDYCDANCQKAHWSKHKLIEVHRKKS
jgi:tetratricopeptide (TPR) repeat protein